MIAVANFYHLDISIEIEPAGEPNFGFRNFDGNTKPQTEFHQRCLDWFIEFISHELNLLPHQLASRIGSDETRDHQATVKAMADLVTAISSATNTSLEEIVSTLSQRDNPPMSTTQSESDNRQETSQPEIYPIQLVFIMLGWISMLYEPVSKPQQSQFQIRTSQSQSTSSRFKKRPQEITNSIAFEGAASLSFPQLVAKFGKRLPEKVMSSNAGITPRQISEDTVKATNVFFSNLRRVGKLNLEWVRSMDHHLDLDEKSRTLKVFAFPSYCALVCLSSFDSNNFLNSLLGNRSSSDADGIQGLFEEYSREVLISFGIIFGQERISRENASKEFQAYDSKSAANDGFVRELCTKRWNEHLLFDYLDSPPIRSNYSARKDFPYLGKKLLRLQAYMDDQSPNDFTTLVFDRRDPLRFWTFVTAIVIGGLSILMNIIQIGLTAAQVGNPS
ncbi:hypothetical protein PG991_000975 [Apiospora marii]|uniref:Uncharacterized protein n=1 Tax=Apiospora marii TaxID=335849 RepID=A0ABR1STK1_9PEZI